MPDGGTLQVALERHVILAVSFADTGTGMTPQQTEKFSNPSSQTSKAVQPGLGRGLPDCAGSRGQGVGTSKARRRNYFVMRLRRFDAERRTDSIPAAGNIAAPRSPAPPQLQAAAAKGGRVANILVCDDERSICEKCSTSLCAATVTASKLLQSGQAAKNKIDGALYDLIHYRHQMPNIDGIEVLRHAHRVSPDSPVNSYHRRGGLRGRGGKR